MLTYAAKFLELTNPDGLDGAAIRSTTVNTYHSARVIRAIRAQISFDQMYPLTQLVWDALV